MTFNNDSNGDVEIRNKPQEGDQFARKYNGESPTVYTVDSVCETGVLLHNEDTHKISFQPWLDFMRDFRSLQQSLLTTKALGFAEYQARAEETAIYPAESKVTYPIIGLLSEAGEVAGKLKKLIRDGQSKITPEFTKAISAELGDVLWYVAAVCTDLDLSLSQVAQDNLDKLAARKQANTIQGSGDNR